MSSLVRYGHCAVGTPGTEPPPDYRHRRSAGLDRLAAAEADPALADHHRLQAVRAHLLDLAGERAARTAYELAARRTLSIPEKRYLESRATRLGMAR